MTPRAAAASFASRAAVMSLVLVAAACAARRDAAPAPTPPPLATPAAPPSATPTPSPTATPTPSPSAAPSPCPPSAERGTSGPRRNVVLIGDSTTYGTPERQPASQDRSIQSPYNPGAALEALLASLEPASKGGTPWRGARVHNLAVGASSTAMWLQDPPAACGTFFELFRIVKTACAKKVPWIDAVRAAIGGAKVDAAIVDLGINDALKSDDPKETVERLKRIRDALAPAPVLFFPPIAPPDGPRRDWPERLRAAMIEAGLFDEKQYPPYVPTWDGLHPTHGGYAAKAGLWLDRLRALP